MALLDSLVGYNLRRAAAHQRERFRNVFAPFDIRPVQLTALTMILKSGPLGQSALGEMLGMKRANVVKLLDELQGRELIRRQTSTRDRRAYQIHLTPKGKRLTSELLELHARLEADLGRAFGREDLRQLVELLKKFRTVEVEPDLS